MNPKLKIGILGCAFASMVLWGCGQSTSKTDKNGTDEAATAPAGNVGKMETQIMDLHEKTMMDMDSIVALKKSLKAIASRVIVTGPDNDSIQANLTRLQKADDAMMDWMNQYNEPDKKMAEDKATAYLTDQLKKIQDVYAEIQHSMQYASAYVKLKK